MNISQAAPGHTVLLRLPEVRARTGLSKPTIYRKISSGEFPKPRKIGRVAVWPASTIETWIQTSVLREGS